VLLSARIIKNGKQMTVNKLHYYLIICSCFLSVGIKAQKRYDVVVYGGTSGGFIAAIQVAKMGKSVALIEPSKHIGGMNVEGLGGTDIDNHNDFQNSPAVGGLALEFYRRISKAYHRDSAFEFALRNKTKVPGLWSFESSVAEKVIKDWLHEYKIDLFYGSPLSGQKGSVQKKGARIISLKTEDGRNFSAKEFIDATIEGDLLAAAGVTTVIGREANSVYNETKNGIRAVTNHAQFMVKVDAYNTPGDPASGVIPTIQNEPLGTPGEGDHRLQAYCFRVCLTQNDSNKIPFYKPDNYNPALYEIYIRYEKAGGKLYKPYVNIPNGKTDLGAWHDLSHNLYGMNFGYASDDYAARKKILKEHSSFTRGLFYFLANDPHISEDTRKAWSSWGYCKDEFKDNNGFPGMFYVRDARRMVSDYVITEHNTTRQNPTIVEDPVAVADWPPDLHSVRRIVKDGFAYNEGAVFGGNNWSPFGISYRALVPKKIECTNLLTPTCPSSSHIAYGAIRIEFTFMALGQACGTAAVMAIDNKKSVQEVDYKKLKKRLIDDKQVIQL
jgi:hypothetical protein